MEMKFEDYSRSYRFSLGRFPQTPDIKKAVNAAKNQRQRWKQNRRKSK